MNALTYAKVNGIGYTLYYNSNGAVTSYDIANTQDDKYIAYNADNQPTKIVIGSSINDATGDVIEQFKYNPEGKIYAKRTQWKENGIYKEENTSYIGGLEYTTYQNDYYSSSYKVSISADIKYVTATKPGSSLPNYKSIEYAHLGQDGSIEVVTNESGTIIEQQAFDAYGSRKSLDWQQKIRDWELSEILNNTANHVRVVRGFTGHLQLERTGFIHMGGRLYDPTLGRFLSPDPMVGRPKNSQNWNRYSYVMNNPMKYSDPTGYDAESKCESTLGEGNCSPDSDEDEESADTELIYAYMNGSTEISGYAFDGFSDRARIFGSDNRLGTSYDNGLSYGIQGELSSDGAQKAGTPFVLPAPAAGGTSAGTGIGSRLLSVLKSPLNIVLTASFLTGDSTNRSAYKYVAYTRVNAAGRGYAGRAGGYGTVEQILARTAASPRHRILDGEGYGPLTLAGFSLERGVIRGREQQLIDFFGGAKSVGGTARNMINGVADFNPNRPFYMNSAVGVFGKMPDNSPDRLRLGGSYGQ